METDDFVHTSGSIDANRSAETRDLFSRNIEKKGKPPKELEKIVLRIEALPVFENFWCPVPFHVLQTAAVGGPVIIGSRHVSYLSVSHWQLSHRLQDYASSHPHFSPPPFESHLIYVIH